MRWRIYKEPMNPIVPDYINIELYTNLNFCIVSNTKTFHAIKILMGQNHNIFHRQLEDAIKRLL